MRKEWFRYYLLVIGSVILTLGMALILRTFVEHRPFSGLLLGAGLALYGFWRLREGRKLFPGAHEK